MRLSNWYRLIVLTVFLFAEHSTVYAQKKIDQVIPDAEKRKVLRAKKMFNQYKIYEGERILKDLINEHPFEYYYHEALVQLQHQVLQQIGPAYAELQSLTSPISKDSLPAASETEASTYQHESMKENQLLAKKDTVAIEWNGLDTEPRKVDKVRSRSSIKVDTEDPVLTEATMTIDSSLLKEDLTEVESTLPLPKLKKTDHSLEKQLKAISELAQIPADSYQKDLIQNCRRATLQVEYADSASAYLRLLQIDTLDPDIRASDEAREAFENGLNELHTNEEIAAQKQFERAIELDADYYSAHASLGDVWRIIGKDANAIREYNKAIALQPNRPEPLEKLSLYYYQRGKFEDAAAASIDAISLYPQQHYFQLLRMIVGKTGKNFNTQWMRREVYPLSTAASYFEVTAKEKTPWWTYQIVEGDVHNFYDSAGIVKPNEKTNERYLDVYAWKQVLKDTAKYFLPFARAMNKIGFLDCYVLVSCFHHDLYQQFSDLAKQNPQKIKDYFYILINWEDKKYDKLRKEFYPKEETKNKKKSVIIDSPKTEKKL